MTYLKLLENKMTSVYGNLCHILPPPKFEIDEDRIDVVRKVSRERYSQKVEVIHNKIKRWSENKKE